MKKNLFTCLFMALAITGFSQITEIKNEPEFVYVTSLKRSNGDFFLEIRKMIENDSSMYVLMFQNAEYKYSTDIKYFVFSTDKATCNGFYEILKSVFKPENKTEEYRRKFFLRKDWVSVTTLIMDSKVFCMVSKDDGHVFLTEAEIDAIFKPILTP